VSGHQREACRKIWTGAFREKAWPILLKRENERVYVTLPTQNSKKSGLPTHKERVNRPNARYPTDLMCRCFSRRDFSGNPRRRCLCCRGLSGSLCCRCFCRRCFCWSFGFRLLFFRAVIRAARHSNADDGQGGQQGTKPFLHRCLTSLFILGGLISPQNTKFCIPRPVSHFTKGSNTRHFGLSRNPDQKSETPKDRNKNRDRPVI